MDARAEKTYQPRITDLEVLVVGLRSQLALRETLLQRRNIRLAKSV